MSLGVQFRDLAHGAPETSHTEAETQDPVQSEGPQPQDPGSTGSGAVVVERFLPLRVPGLTPAAICPLWL